MEEPGPASEANVMEGTEVGSVSEGPHPVDQLHNSTSNIEEEEEEEPIPHHNADEGEKCIQANGEPQLDSELTETLTDVQSDTETQPEARTCNREHSERSQLNTDTGCDRVTICSQGEMLPLSREPAEPLVAPVTTLAEVVESSPSVPEGTIETLLPFDDVKDSHATTPTDQEQTSVLVPDFSAAADDSGSAESPSSSDRSTSKCSPTDCTTTSGISNGPSTPISDTVSSSLASSPQTSANPSAPTQSLSSPYDTDCSRKLISQIQRSLSQESLLDELESELLACQLPEGGGGGGGETKGSSTVNGLTTDQEGCMVVFEKCVQYKYSQQEKAIQR